MNSRSKSSQKGKGKRNDQKGKQAKQTKNSESAYLYESEKIRNEKNRAGDISDDSDNEVKEDESIDDDGSDVGWDSDDELAYGHIFTKNKSKNGSKTAKDDVDDEDESDQEEPRQNEVLLSDLFTTNKTTAKAFKQSKSEDDLEGEMEVDDNDNDDDEGSEHSDDDSNDDDDDDEEEEEEDEEEDVDDDDDVDDEAHHRLMKAIDEFARPEDGISQSKKKNIANRASQAAAESIYAQAGNQEAVSMDDLLGALGNSKSLNNVKKQLKDVGETSFVPAYVEKVTSERVERSLTYENTALDMTKWQEIVTTNRNSRTLDLAQDKRQVPNYRNLVQKFTPTTDMEREVQMVLVQTGIFILWRASRT